MTGWLTRHLQSLLFAAGRLVRAPLSTAFTVLVIAIALTLPTAFGLAILSVRDATGNFADAVDVSVYFRKGVTPDPARQLARNARQRDGVASVDLISADDALKSFREQSGFGAALDVLGDNPLPHALDIRPRPDATSPAQMESLRKYLAAWPEVELVQVDSEWVQRLNAILDLLRRLVLGTTVLLGLGVLAVIGNTIRLEIYSRRAEIEVTKLVGGSNASCAGHSAHQARSTARWRSAGGAARGAGDLPATNRCPVCDQLRQRLSVAVAGPAGSRDAAGGGCCWGWLNPGGGLARAHRTSA
jgi:cell division transport system permease protein